MSTLCGSRTGPDSKWHRARSESESAFDSEVRISANKKSDHVTSRHGVATRSSVAPKKSLDSYNIEEAVKESLR